MFGVQSTVESAVGEIFVAPNENTAEMRSAKLPNSDAGFTFVIAAVLAIFLVDIFTPFGITVGLFYLLPILYCVRSYNPRRAMALAALCSVLLIADVPLKPPGGSLLIGLINDAMVPEEGRKWGEKMGTFYSSVWPTSAVPAAVTSPSYGRSPPKTVPGTILERNAANSNSATGSPPRKIFFRWLTFSP